LGINPTNAQILNLRILRALRLGLWLWLGLKKLKGPEDILKSPQDPQVLILERKLN